MNSKPHEIIIYGATSFVGKILVAYLVKNYGIPSEQSDEKQLRWAIGARSASKLDALKAEHALGDIPTYICDAENEAALTDMVKDTQVIVSTVGPYALYGSTLVAVCAQTGTDYCDLTGEVQWMQRMIDHHQSAAEASGARLVHNCGFDSIPSDLGVWYTQQQCNTQLGSYAKQIKMRVKKLRGGMSGGTVASLVNVIKESSNNPALRKLMQNPYAVAPHGQRKGVRQPNVRGASFDKDFQQWLAPFIMAAINTRVVHRSNALQDYAWGEEFLYDEATLMGKGAAGRFRAYGLVAGLGVFMSFAAVSASRKILERFVLPAPGEGPTPEEQEKGCYDLRFLATTPEGKELRAKVTGDKDPGYGSTAKMLAEAAICMARETPKSELGGGFWTPSLAMGQNLVDRLEANAGLSFSCEQQA